MRYYVLAADYDGTLAQDGLVEERTVASLRRLRESGRRLILVTGRELPDLRRVAPPLDLFDRVVAENGAVVLDPATGEERALAPPPSPAFVAELRTRGVGPISVGRVIVATWKPHEVTVLEVIRDLKLEAQVIFNKGAVMVLPSGMNKAKGLDVALAELKLSQHNVVAIGDAENDLAFLARCECGVAVANALPSVKKRADWVTRGDHGAGVRELAERLRETDLADLPPLVRHDLSIGQGSDGSEVRVPSYGRCLLLAGSSGGGKTTFARMFIEQLLAHGYQFCVVDPEGDYLGFPECLVLGTTDKPPQVEELLEVLRDPTNNVVINMLGVPRDDRPRVFESLLPPLAEMRSRSGRPHWIVVDEAHHLIPAQFGRSLKGAPRQFQGVLMISAYPRELSEGTFDLVDAMVGVGEDPAVSLQSVSRAVREPLSMPPRPEGASALYWNRAEEAQPFWFTAESPQVEIKRHRRKYAEGELAADLSFYFRGPEGKLNLRAYNLRIFLQLAEGVDDETWLFHLQRHDYSRWLEEIVHDQPMAQAVEAIERDGGPPAESRQRVRSAIREHFAV